MKLKTFNELVIDWNDDSERVRKEAIKHIKEFKKMQTDYGRRHDSSTMEEGRIGEILFRKFFNITEEDVKSK